MDTQRPEEHGLLAWFLSFMHRAEHQDSGWQRERQQETGGYELPNIIGNVAGGAPWKGPLGSRTAAYWEEHRHTGYTPIPATPQETGEMRLPVSPLRERARLRGISEVPTDKQLPGPEWLYGQLPANVLPPHVGNAPVLRQQTGRLDAMLLTLRPDHRLREQAQMPAIYDLPTVKSHERVISQALEALPPQLPLPEQMIAAFNDTPVLAPMSEDASAWSDKIAQTINDLFDLQDDECKPDLDPTELTESREAVRERARLEEIIKKIQESE